MEEYIINRHGEKEPIEYDKITIRNENLCSDQYGKVLNVKVREITKNVAQWVRPGITTQELDHESVRACIKRAGISPDYMELATRIIVSNMQKSAPPTFSAATKKIYETWPVLLSSDYLQFVMDHAAELDALIVSQRDFNLPLMGITNVVGFYIIIDSAGTPLETYQYLLLRFAISINLRRTKALARVERLYNNLSRGRFLPASVTLINGGKKNRQLSSCFVLSVGDSITELSRVLSDILTLSSRGGGLGICLTPMRSNGQFIGSTGGRMSYGIRDYVPILESIRHYSTQGGRRPGAFATYLEIWHDDIFTFLELGRTKGPLATTHRNAPNLKYGLWVPDLFMEKLEDELNGDPNVQWFLFSPDDAPELYEVFDNSTPPQKYKEPEESRKFTKLYTQYVFEKKYKRIVKPSQIMTEWFKTVVQIGSPYICFKDAFNRNSNMSHIKTIQSSNLCAEIGIPFFSTPTNNHIATCNLGSIPLLQYTKNGLFDFESLAMDAGELLESLDGVITAQIHYLDATESCSLQFRAVGIGMVGLAEVFIELGLEFESLAAIDLGAAITACIYYGAMVRSAALVNEGGFESFPAYSGSHASRGVLLPDLYYKHGFLNSDWEDRLEKTTRGFLTPSRWKDLRAKIKRGLRNAAVTALMPTVSASTLSGLTENFEPINSLVYTRNSITGEQLIVNQQLLDRAGKDREKVYQAIIDSNGSIQNVPNLPPTINKLLFKTAREIDQLFITRHAIARAPFVSQSMSLNYFFNTPVLKNLLQVLHKGWRGGLSTGSYYIYFTPAAGGMSCKSCNA